MRDLLKVIEVKDHELICESARGDTRIVSKENYAHHKGDVIEFGEGNGYKVLHDASQQTGCLYVTNKCNSNCVMCPDPPQLRRLANVQTLDFLKEYLQLLPTDLPFLDLTGGEPTLLKYDLSELLQLAMEHFEDTYIMMLTNGRAFADRTYTSSFGGFRNKNLTIEVPFHAGEDVLHDRIAGATGSFLQTQSGVKNLLSHGLRLGIRIVVSKLNYHEIENIIHYVGVSFPQIRNINLMGLEMLGNARSNQDLVWIEFEELRDILQKSVQLCFYYGIEPQLYNFPLCMFAEKFWSIYRKSISEHKVVYLDSCEDCKLKSYCGGFFSSTARITNYNGKAIMADHA